MPDVVWMVVLALVTVGFVAAMVGTNPKEAPPLPDAPRAKIADVPEGAYRHIVGRVSKDKEWLRSPLTDQPCAAYVVVVEEPMSQGHMHGFRQVLSEQRAVSFAVVDESGRARVEPDVVRVELEAEESSEVGGLTTPNEAQQALLLRHGHSGARARRFREGILEPGAQVAVMGNARWLDDPSSASDPGYRGTGAARVLELSGRQDAPVVIRDARHTRESS